MAGRFSKQANRETVLQTTSSELVTNKTKSGSNSTWTHSCILKMLFVVESQHPLAVKYTAYAKKSIRSSFILESIHIFFTRMQSRAIRIQGWFCRNMEARGGYCHIWAIWVCAAVKGMFFEQVTLAQGI